MKNLAMMKSRRRRMKQAEGVIMSFEGEVPKIAEGVWIAPTAVVIGAVELGRNVSIWPGAILRGDVNRISIGEGSNIQDGAVIHVTPMGEEGIEYPTIIGPHVTVGHGAMLHGCVIEEGALIGMRAIVMDGARVEKGGVLGAGALLGPNKVVKAGEVWVGAPARRVRRLSDEEQAELYRSAEQYVSLKERYERDAKVIADSESNE